MGSINKPSTILKRISWFFRSFFFLLSSRLFSLDSLFNLFLSFLASLSSLSELRLPFLSGVTSASSPLESSLASALLFGSKTNILHNQDKLLTEEGKVDLIYMKRMDTCVSYIFNIQHYE